MKITIDTDKIVSATKLAGKAAAPVADKTVSVTGTLLFGTALAVLRVTDAVVSTAFEVGRGIAKDIKS